MDHANTVCTVLTPDVFGCTILLISTQYHGSHATRSLTDARERGLFVHPDRAVAESHGPVVTAFELDEDVVLSNYVLNYEIADDEQIALIRSVLAEETACGSDQDRAWEIVVESAGCDGAEDELEMFRSETAAEAGWEAQRIRGCVARALGYRAIEIHDEHGHGTLLLVG